MTEIELNVLGLVMAGPEEPLHRELIEKNCGAMPKLAYLIVNDLKQFGFIVEDSEGRLSIQPRGERALQGICRRIYEKRFHVEMLTGFSPDRRIDVEISRERGDHEQTTLF